MNAGIRVRSAAARFAAISTGVITAAAMVLGAFAAGAAEPPHNVILFVADGLRASIVDGQTAPHLAALRDEGVDFRNSHSLFPTLTTANASALATGHYLGDTGNWANVICFDFDIASVKGRCPFLENDPTLTEIVDHYGGSYLGEKTILAVAREAGYGTAAVGKLGPVLIQDPDAAHGNATIVIDDLTGKTGQDGRPLGVPLQKPIEDRLSAAGLTPPPPGAAVPNGPQQDYFLSAFTKVVLPTLKERGKPFLAIFWSRDPDGSQHNQSESKGRLVPGINGRLSLGGIANADANLAAIRDSLAAQGQDGTTDIIVVADHGFSTITKESLTSAAKDGADGTLPAGFLAIDLARGLGTRLFEPDGNHEEIAAGAQPKRGSAILGDAPQDPIATVVANGGSDLIYLPKPDRDRAKAIVAALLRQDYVSGLFVRDDLGPIAGALPFSAIGLTGAAKTPAPAIIVNFKSFATGCDKPVRCAVEIADTPLGQGQGMHGSFSRADTNNFQAAIGPDFKRKFVDPAPSSNADIGVTIAHILGLMPPSHGTLGGRVLTEAMPGGATPTVSHRTIRSQPAENGLATIVETQSAGGRVYYDVGGFPGRSVGLAAEAAGP